MSSRVGVPGAAGDALEAERGIADSGQQCRVKNSAPGTRAAPAGLAAWIGELDRHRAGGGEELHAAGVDGEGAPFAGLDRGAGVDPCHALTRFGDGLGVGIGCALGEHPAASVVKCTTSSEPGASTGSTSPVSAGPGWAAGGGGQVDSATRFRKMATAGRPRWSSAQRRPNSPWLEASSGLRYAV